MKRYGSYKATKYTWLTEVPSHWKTQTLRSLTTVRSERRGEKEATLLSVYREYGVIIKSSRNDNHNVESEDLSNYKVVHKGDLVMNKMKMWQGSLGISNLDGVVSPAYIVCHINDATLNLRYLHTLLRSPLFKTYYNQFSYGVRVGQWDMHYEDFKGLEISIPPRDEQDQIVRYLDWQVSKINRLIAAKRKQIELLSEEKQNIINAAVLHGVNDRCEKRTSPILFADWIPSHWRVLRGKYLFAEHDRRTETGNEVLLSVSHITGVTPRSEKNITMFQAESLVGYKICSVDDIAANTMWMWQGAIAVSDYYGVISPSYNTYHQIGNHYNRKYLDYLLRSNVMVNEYKAKSTGIRKSRLRLYPEQFLSMSFPIPPMDEQLEIVKYIEAKIQRIEVMVSTIHAEIQKIQDLRARLISDVVTGQIDVRGIEVPTFEYIDESNNNDENTEEMEAELDG